MRTFTPLKLLPARKKKGLDAALPVPGLIRLAGCLARIALDIDSLSRFTQSDYAANRARTGGFTDVVLTARITSKVLTKHDSPVPLVASDRRV